MRNRYSFILLIVVVAAALFAPAVLAGSPPSIYSVSEGKDPGNGQPTLSISGKGMTQYVTFQLAEAGTAVSHGAPDVLSRKSTLLVLRLPADLLPGAYVLTVADKKGVGVDLAVSIGNGRPLPGSVGSESLDPALLAALEDAGNLTGTLSTAQFSAYADLAAEGKVGTGASQVADGDHVHDARYPTKTDLGATGTINTGTNPVDWSQLKGVPAGFADGADDVEATWTVSGADIYRSSGRVGVGTTTPAADLHIRGDRGVLFDAGTGVKTIPMEGAGDRMMWYQGKTAFRAGHVNGAQWDDANVGDKSAALGSNTTASGQYSFAGGDASTASGMYSFAMGIGATASAEATTAIGYSPTASGQDSTAIGTLTTASGFSSTALGYGTKATGDYSTAMGVFTTAQAYNSVVLGWGNVVAGSKTSWVSTDPALVVGNAGPSAPNSNAFTLLKNGNLTIAGTLTQNSDLRMKKDVMPLTGVLSRIAGLRGISYEFKDTTRCPEGRQIGLVAQEVQAAFPELVREDTQGTLSVSYQNFTAVLLEAVKEQQVTLDRQQGTIDARDREVAALKEKAAETDARLARLEAALPVTPPGKGGR